MGKEALGKQHGVATGIHQTNLDRINDDDCADVDQNMNRKIISN